MELVVIEQRLTNHLFMSDSWSAENVTMEVVNHHLREMHSALVKRGVVATVRHYSQDGTKRSYQIGLEDIGDGQREE